MALKSTIYKAVLQVADIDHGFYQDLSLTLARHPSETDERMMIRLAAMALSAHALQDRCQGDGRLAFGAGLSDPDDPDMSLTDFTGRKRLWVEVGQPEDKPLTRACSQADEVVVYAYQSSSPIWWRNLQSKVMRLDRLSVWHLPVPAGESLSRLAERSMQLQATVQEGEVTFSSDKGSVHIELTRWK